jgi:hypothetical protein
MVYIIITEEMNAVELDKYNNYRRSGIENIWSKIQFKNKQVYILKNDPSLP